MSNPQRFPDAPDRILSLPTDDRGFPVPFFVGWADGKPVFPAADAAKMARCYSHQLCWVCGRPLGRFKTYVVGPMCVVNRVSSEPPSHLDCAQFSATNCPFLNNPAMKRVPPEKMGVDTEVPGGKMIERNPGVTALVTVTGPVTPFRAGNGYLFQIGEPDHVEWYARGRQATGDEVRAAMELGLPLLQAMVKGPDDQAALDSMAAAAEQFIPA